MTDEKKEATDKACPAPSAHIDADEWLRSFPLIIDPFDARSGREVPSSALAALLDSVRRATVEVCAAWLRSEHDPEAADGWERDALRAADELSRVSDMFDAVEKAGPRTGEEPR